MNAKVVTTVWGTKWIQFIAALAILHQDDLKKRDPVVQFFISYCVICPILQIVLVQNM